ncbi:HAD-IA family hydrolase [Chlorogloeopsis sp. ULAP02]|uniref:HAD family hydrolase n=1 Tax=Chlorogloeopsis sp. ULAP02 TaxID=3107926 RepID=UPI00313563BA
MSISPIAPTPPYTALIFDCDGTLADTLSLHYKAWSESVQVFGAHMEREWYYNRTGISTVELIQILNATYGYQLDVEQVKTEKNRRYRQLLHTVKEIQPVAEIVRTNYGKVPMAIASGGSRYNIQTTLKAIRLTNFFDSTIAIEDVALGKPAPDIFLLAAQKLKVKPSECIVYEDSNVGLEAAQLAGMRGIDVRSVLKHLEATTSLIQTDSQNLVP